MPDYTSPVVLRRGKCSVEDFCNGKNESSGLPLHETDESFQQSTRKSRNSSSMRSCGDRLRSMPGVKRLVWIISWRMRTSSVSIRSSRVYGIVKHSFARFALSYTVPCRERSPKLRSITAFSNSPRSLETIVYWVYVSLCKECVYNVHNGVYYRTKPATRAPAPNSPPNPGTNVIAPETGDVAAAAL